MKMFNTLKTLIFDATPRAEETLRDTDAIEVINRKTREAGEGLRAAKGTAGRCQDRKRMAGYVGGT
jgi:lipocalin